MSGKFKALGLGMLVAMTVSAVAAVSATATYSGHFVSEVQSTTVTGSETATHRTRFSVAGGTPIECTKVSYAGSIGAETVAGFTVTPKHEECKTEGAAAHNITIKMNECTYTFKSTAETHATFLFFCGANRMEIHHPNCTIKVVQETPVSGVSYTTVVEDGKHALTANLTLENIAVQYHSGICSFLGTNQKASLKGSLTLKGTDEAGKPVHVTNT